MKNIIDVENIKCGGCANSIVSKLEALEGVSCVEVLIEDGRVQFEADEALVAEVKEQLLRMGYPEKGSVEGLSSMGAKAKSFVSCALGKI